MSRPSRGRRYLADDEEDARVADDDGQTGQQEGDDEEELFGRPVRVVLQDRTRADVRVQAETAPPAEQRRHQRAETAQPRQADHHDQVAAFVQSANDGKNHHQNGITTGASLFFQVEALE